MTDVFVLRNQYNAFLNKAREWIAAGDSKTLFRTQHRDDVINEKVELTVKNPELRIKVVNAEQASNGRIQLDGEDPIPRTSVQTGEGKLLSDAPNTSDDAIAEPSQAKCSQEVPGQSSLNINETNAPEDALTGDVIASLDSVDGVIIEAADDETEDSGVAH